MLSIVTDDIIFKINPNVITVHNNTSGFEIPDACSIRLYDYKTNRQYRIIEIFELEVIRTFTWDGKYTNLESYTLQTHKDNINKLLCVFQSQGKNNRWKERLLAQRERRIELEYEYYIKCLI